MSKKKSKKRRVYVLEDGSRYNVVGENGVYFFCEGGVQFRKAAKRGVIVEEGVPTASASAADAEEKEG